MGKYPFKQRIGLQELFFSGIHNCVDLAYYTVNILRACGVPSVVVYQSANKFYATNHCYVAVLDKNGDWQIFNPENNMPTKRYEFKESLNLFFLNYQQEEQNPHSISQEKESPPIELRYPGLKDCTSFFRKTYELSIPFSGPDRALAYLASFYSQNINGIIPVTWGIVDQEDKCAIFRNIVPNNLYFPIFYNGDSAIGFSEPFILIEDSLQKAGFKIHKYTSSKKENSRISVWLHRKYPIKPRMKKLAEKTKGSIVIASNLSNFKTADTLAAIESTPLNDWQDLILPGKKAYKNYRIIPADGHVYISEIEYLTDTIRHYPNTISPKPLVPGNYKKEETSTRWTRLLAEPLKKTLSYKISDNNVTTAPESSINTSFRLSTPQVIDRIRFTINKCKQCHLLWSLLQTLRMEQREMASSFHEHGYKKIVVAISINPPKTLLASRYNIRNRGNAIFRG